MALEHYDRHFDKKNRNTKNYHMHYLKYIHAIKVFPIKLQLHVYIVTHVHEHLVWLVVRLSTQ